MFAIIIVAKIKIPMIDKLTIAPIFFAIIFSINLIVLLAIKLCTCANFVMLAFKQAD